ncbi:MAG: hypothetical protein IK063_00480 [Clostridia bacterium]|nr:hypothetical protein [Clostridia bacterium]
MNKKIIITIICAALVIVAAVATGVYFLGYSTGKKTAEAGQQEISEPECALDDFVLYDTAVDQYATTEGFGAAYLTKCFNMSEQDANDLVEHPENWLGFQAFFSIKNTDVDELSISAWTALTTAKTGLLFLPAQARFIQFPKKAVTFSVFPF